VHVLADGDHPHLGEIWPRPSACGAEMGVLGTGRWRPGRGDLGLAAGFLGADRLEGGHPSLAAGGGALLQVGAFGERPPVAGPRC